MCTKVYVPTRIKIPSFQNFWSRGMRIGISLWITVGLCSSEPLQWDESMQRAMRQDLERTQRISSPETIVSEDLVMELNFWRRSKPHNFKWRRMYTWGPFSCVMWLHEAASFMKSQFSQIVTKIRTIFMPRYFITVFRRANMWTFSWEISYASHRYIVFFLKQSSVLILSPHL